MVDTDQIQQGDNAIKIVPILFLIPYFNRLNMAVIGWTGPGLILWCKDAGW
jgi:hypothetical protein